MVYLSSLSTMVKIVLLMAWHLQLDVIVQLQTFHWAEPQWCEEKQGSMATGRQEEEEQWGTFLRSREQGYWTGQTCQQHLLYSRPPEALCTLCCCLRAADSQNQRITPRSCWIDFQLWHYLSSNHWISITLCFPEYIHLHIKYTKRAACLSLKTTHALMLQLCTSINLTHSAVKKCTKIWSSTEFQHCVLLINIEAFGQFIHNHLMMPYCEGGGFMKAELQEENRCPIWAEMCWEYQV